MPNLRVNEHMKKVLDAKQKEADTKVDRRIDFRVDLITKITVEYQRVSDLKWYDERPEKRTFFGLIKNHSYRRAGFGNTGWDDEVSIKSPETIGSYYNIDDANKIAYLKPKVSIRFHNDVINTYFDTDEEANQWVEQIKVKAYHNFETIYR